MIGQHLGRAKQLLLRAFKWLPSGERLKSLFRRRVTIAILVAIVAVCFSLLWYFIAPLRPYLVPIGTALGALFAAIPGLVTEDTRGRWIPAILGSVVVGLVTWYTTLNLETKLEQKQGDLETTQKELKTVERRYQTLEHDVRNIVLALPEEERQAVILQASRALAYAYRTDVLEKQRPEDRTYEQVDDLVKFMLSIDRSNGHALYYAGQAKRARKMKDVYQDDWFRYLEAENSLPADSEERSGSTSISACEKNPRGYCRQRTAWIQHLLANDYFEDGRKAADQKKKRDGYQIALKYARATLTNFPGGFRGSGQGIPTTDLQRLLEEELKKLDGSLPST